MTESQAPQRKEPAYLKLMSEEKADGIYLRILEKLTKEKLYRDPSFSSRQAFYLAFHRLYKETPREYRLKVQKGEVLTAR